MQATVSLFSALVAEPFDWGIIHGVLDVGPIANILGFFPDTVRCRDTGSNSWHETQATTVLGDSDDEDGGVAKDQYKIVGLRGGRQYEVSGTMLPVGDLTDDAVAVLVKAHGGFHWLAWRFQIRFL
jgi:hypothetical protein